MQRWILGTMAAASLSLALPVFAQFAKADDAIKYRQSALYLQNYHLSRLVAMVSGRAPFDPKAAAEHAQTLAAVTMLPFAAFVDGSHKGETRAKPEIWTEKEKFNAAANKLHEDVLQLVAATKTGNQAQIKSAVGTVGKTCKSCHEDYKTAL